MFHSPKTQLKNKKGSVIFFFLAFFLVCTGFISLSLFVGSRVHHQIKVSQAADAAARAGAAHESVGLNMIAANNLAIASALQINHSLLLMAYYGGLVRALMYGVADGIVDLADAFQELLNLGHQIQEDVFDRFNTIGSQFYKASKGLSTYNMKIRDYWVYLALFKVIELGRLNDPGSLTIPFKGDGQGIPFVGFKYSPTKSGEKKLTDKYMFNSSAYDAICLTTALAAPDDAGHDSMIEWITGPLKSFATKGTDVAASILDGIGSVIKIANKFAPVRLGLIECGIGLKSPVFDLLSAGGSSWVASLAARWGDRLTADIFNGWNALFQTESQVLCSSEKNTYYGAAMAALTAFDFGHSEEDVLALSMKSLWDQTQDRRKKMLHRLALCYPYVSGCAKTKPVRKCHTYHRWLKKHTRCTTTYKCVGGVVPGDFSDPDPSVRKSRELYTAKTCDTLKEQRLLSTLPSDSDLPDRNESGLLATYHVSAPGVDYWTLKKGRALTEVNKLLDKLVPSPVFNYSSKSLKECKMDASGKLPPGCNETFHLREKSYLCPYKGMLLDKGMPSRCSLRFCFLFGCTGHKVYARKWAYIAMMAKDKNSCKKDPNDRDSEPYDCSDSHHYVIKKEGGKYNCSEYQAFKKTSGKKNLGMQLISWGMQAEAHEKINRLDNKPKESNLGFMVINKAKRNEFYQKLSIKSLLISPIWNSSEYDSIKECDHHKFSISVNDKSIERCKLEIYRQIGFGTDVSTDLDKVTVELDNPDGGCASGENERVINPNRQNTEKPNEPSSIFASIEDCARAASKQKSCTTTRIQWSETHSTTQETWGCKCCTSDGNGKDNADWQVFNTTVPVAKEKELALVEGSLGKYVDSRFLIFRSQLAMSKYRPVYLPMPSDYNVGSGNHFNTHLLTLWPSWTVIPDVMNFEDLSGADTKDLKAQDAIVAAERAAAERAAAEEGSVDEKVEKSVLKKGLHIIDWITGNNLKVDNS